MVLANSSAQCISVLQERFGLLHLFSQVKILAEVCHVTGISVELVTLNQIHPRFKLVALVT